MDKKEHDKFCEIVKNKLENYSLPVDNDSWDQLAKRLNPTPKKKIDLRWLAATAVTASIALLFLLSPFFNKKTYQYETASPFPSHEKTIIQDVSEKEIAQSAPTPTVEPAATLQVSRSSNRTAENNLAVELILKEEITEESKGEIPQENNPVVQPVVEPNVRENQILSVYNDNPWENELASVSKPKKQQSVRFTLGSGGNLLADNATNASREHTYPPGLYSISNASMFRSSATYELASSKTDEILLIEDYPDPVHRLPLSFGITFKTELNQTFAIESGIVYSFLASEYSKEFPQRKADLQLHYLGIPLNLHARILGNRFSQWEVYLAAGGMVEKGVLKRFVQKTYSNSYESTITSREKINGLQWSVGISPGVDFQIHKSYSVYVEPRLSYYFDNNQPRSARTDNQLVIGLNAGVRYIW